MEKGKVYACTCQILFFNPSLLDRYSLYYHCCTPISSPQKSVPQRYFEYDANTKTLTYKTHQGGIAQGSFVVSGVRSHEDTAGHAEVFEILRSDGKNPLLCAGLAINTTSPFDEFPDAKVTMMRAIEASLNPKVPLPKDLSRNSEDIRARADSEKVTDKRTLESMTKAAEVMIQAWEMGDEESYRSFVSTENGGMSLEIPAQSLDVNGFDAIWQIRSSMGNDPLDIHKVGEAVADGNILTVVVKITNRKTGVSSMFLHQLTFSASLTCEKFWVGPMNETKGDNRLAGKVCVVLGGTGNIGAGVAFAYASEGAKVIITGRTHEKIAASRKQWGWPTSVSGLALDFNL